MKYSCDICGKDHANADALEAHENREHSTSLSDFEGLA